MEEEEGRKINISDYIKSFAGHQKKTESLLTEEGLSREEAARKKEERKALLLRISEFLKGPGKEVNE